MAINKIPKNYYSDTNIRRDKINEIIDEVNDIASIPSPSEADAGKVVKVSAEGSYELAQDAGAKVLTITLASNFTADKTYTEILTALNNGDIVKLVTWSEQNYIYSGIYAGRICFACINGSSDSGMTNVDTIAVDDTNSWEQLLDNIEQLPDVTSADAGKVLSVDNNGDWGLGDRDVFYVDATIDSASTPTKITLKGMTRTDLINSAALYKEHIIVAKTADEKSSLFFHQFRDNNDPVQRSLNFFSFGISYGSVDRIYSCAVLPSPSSSDINVLTKTLVTQ